MKIKINELSDKPAVFTGEIDQDVIGKREEDDFRFEKPLRIKATITKSSSSVTAVVKVSAPYASLCSRCWEPASGNWDIQFTTGTAINRNTEEVDLTEEIRQEIILSLPLRVMCEQSRDESLQNTIYFKKEGCANYTKVKKEDADMMESKKVKSTTTPFADLKLKEK